MFRRYTLVLTVITVLLLALLVPEVAPDDVRDDALDWFLMSLGVIALSFVVRFIVTGRWTF